MQETINNYNLEMFFEISQDFLCIAGFDGYFKRVNPAFLNILGYTEVEILSKPIDEFIFHEDRSQTSLRRKNLINNTSLFHFENRYLTKKGEILWLSWTSIPLSNERLVYAIAKDITFKKQMEEERYHLLSNLDKSNKDLKQLTYRTSHDLRSPVNNIMVLIDLVDTSKIEDEETLEVISLLKLSTNGLKENLNEFVDSLSENNKNIYVSLEELQIAKCLENVMISINSLISTSGAIFKFNISDVPTVKFNKTYLESIFLNLITNSIKYSKPDQSPEILIETERIDNDIQIKYSDKGLGFNLERDKKKIFGLNQKFHHHSDSKGVGLYLIYNYISSLGGQIEVESELNEGATFIITIPN